MPTGKKGCDDDDNCTSCIVGNRRVADTTRLEMIFAAECYSRLDDLEERVGSFEDIMSVPRGTIRVLGYDCVI